MLVLLVGVVMVLGLFKELELRLDSKVRVVVGMVIWVL